MDVIIFIDLFYLKNKLCESIIMFLFFNNAKNIIEKMS